MTLKHKKVSAAGASPDPAKVLAPVQTWLARKRFASWIATNGSIVATGSTYSNGSAGTSVNRAPTFATYYTSRYRTGFNSNAASNSSSFLFSATSVVLRQIGFRLVLRWGCSDAAATTGARSVAGLYTNASFGGNPSTTMVAA
jgi:hypothetical protein